MTDDGHVQANAHSWEHTAAVLMDDGFKQALAG